MKAGIHPEYKDCTVTCACGARFQLKSTRDVMNVEICSTCHPFYTGKLRIVDSTGRVDRFKKKYKLK